MLEEYEKSEIVNSAYMGKIMRVLENRKETKKIISKKNQFILQISDGKDSVNIYQKGKCYCINLNGTNFSSIIAAEGGAYLYKNKKLDIEYRLSEVGLNEGTSKKISIIKIKDYKSANSYIDDHRDFTLLYSDKPGVLDERIIICNEVLAKLDDHSLSNFLKERNIAEKKEIEESEEKLPQDIDDFDYSKYDDDENETEEQIEEMEEYYKNYVCKVNGEEISGEEKIQILQEIDRSINDSDNEFSIVSERIEDIITTYESEQKKFKSKVKSTKNIKDEPNTQIKKGQNDGPEQ